MLVAPLLAACAALPRPDGVDAVLADLRFGAPRAPVGADGLFEVSDEMRRFAQTGLAASIAARGSHAGLYRAVRDGLTIDYDAASTRTAADTFAARSGNCLSLVILTAAFAKHLDIPFRYQAVHAEGAWSRAGGLAFYSGHVNLRLGPTACPSCCSPWTSSIRSARRASTCGSSRRSASSRCT